jgi:hypothetical protein
VEGSGSPLAGLAIQSALSDLSPMKMVHSAVEPAVFARFEIRHFAHEVGKPLLPI